MRRARLWQFIFHEDRTVSRIRGRFELFVTAAIRAAATWGSEEAGGCVTATSVGEDLKVYPPALLSRICCSDISTHFASFPCSGKREKESDAQCEGSEL